MRLPIKDRNTAGQLLAAELQKLTELESPIVLALPRGGVPVAFEIAKRLNAPLDLLLVRKLGVPMFPELAMGAIASGSIKVLNQSVLQGYAITPAIIAKVETEEQAELERREHAYRGNSARLRLQNRNIILVDDGLATGASMQAAVQAVRQQAPASITVAVPVAPIDTVMEIRRLADIVICPFTPSDFSAIGQYYEAFPQVSDQEVKNLLAEIWH